MKVYYYPFLWLIVMWFLYRFEVTTKEEVLEDGTIVKRWSYLWAFVCVLPILYVAAFTTPRSDTILYLNLYNNLEASLSNLKQVLLAHEGGFGFVVFEILIKMIFGSDETIFRVILALFHMVPIVLVCRKYSKNYLLSIFLFVACGYHLAWMMNGLRQFMAVSMIFGATPWILDKKYVSAILVILLATTFHTSALMMLPVIFIVQGETWNNRTMLFLFVVIVAMYYFGNNVESMDTLLQGTEYEGAMENAVQMGDDGANPIRVFVNAIPMLLAIYGRISIQEKDDSVMNLCVNMSVITTGIYLVAMVTSGIMIGRLPIYTGLYALILLPSVLEHVFTQRSLDVVTKIMILFYLLMYFVEFGGY